MSLVKSKQRVADHGEVFTPPWMVEAMLDLVKGETERIDSRFLEPACGSGNFLIQILLNKWLHEVNWDLVVFDEYHFGAGRDTAKELFEGEDEAEAKKEAKLEYTADLDEVNDDLGVLSEKEADFLPITTRAYLYLATRIPAFMYLTDFRENTLQDVITKIEPDLFKVVTGLTVADFHLLVRLKVFNTEQMNQAVFAFRRYEDASLRYTGIESHKGLTHYGLYDTVVAKE